MIYRTDLYPQSDNVMPVRHRLRNAGYDGQTLGDGQVLDALYAQEGDIDRAARWLVYRGEARPSERRVPSYLYTELVV